MIAIVDYGMGNMGSILNMLRRVGAQAFVTRDPAEVAKASKLILPGVGRFDRAMELLEERGLRAALDVQVHDHKVPILGICLGMQLMTRHSQEGDAEGLGWLAADTRRFPEGSELKVPHMGWNLVRPVRESPLTAGLPDASRFYFVHSYYVRVDDDRHSILKADYGVPFDAAVQDGHVYGVQFHPEKSHRFGMTLLGNFARL